MENIGVLNKDYEGIFLAASLTIDVLSREFMGVTRKGGRPMKLLQCFSFADTEFVKTTCQGFLLQDSVQDSVEDYYVNLPR